MKTLTITTFMLLLATFALGQKAGVTVETVFFGVAPQAVSLPLPSYPSAAKKIGLGGRVKVPITVDPTGNVVKVGAVHGPYPVCQAVIEPNVVAIRKAAFEAAGKASFTRGQSIDNVEGFIVYDFLSGNEGESLTSTTVGVMNTGTEAPRLLKGTDAGTKTMVAANLPDSVSGGVLNGKATALPKPKYPAAAKAVRAGGSVNVQVLIAYDGTMYSAKAVSGHPLLRASSEFAACNSAFLPTLLSGQPVKVSGIITYIFVP